MDVNREWTDEVIAEIDKAIARGNVDEDILKTMKELIKAAKLRTSITEYFKDQEE